MFPAGFVVVGLLFVVLGLLQVRSGRRFRAVARQVPGVVTALSYRSDSDGGGCYYPVLRFATVEGRPVDTVSFVGRSPAPARVGDHVQVLYDPADPRRARLPGFAFEVVAITCVVMGLAAVAVGLGAAAVLA